MLKKLKHILPYPIIDSKINYLKLIGGGFLCLIILLFFLGITDETAHDGYAEIQEESEESSCNIIRVILHGEITTYIPNEGFDSEGNHLYDQSSSDDVIYALDIADSDDNVKAIVIEIDSVGGGPVAAEEIANALKRTKKLTVVLIREYGDSAAYYAATGADIIFASANSDIGCIGVTASYSDNARKNQKDGLTYNQLSSGKFKDMFNPDKILTAEEKQLIMRDIKILHENFVNAVAENRNLDINKVRKLADGSSMLGQMALENGLIDRIGGINKVKEYIEGEIGEEMTVCW